ncbi:MAG: primosomal protein N' [Clostridiales bacterium]|nr:primosomal protein N' [Clostridiales bacterium]
MNPTLVAQIAVEQTAFSFDKPYDYLIPETLRDKVQPGCRVMVPFGRSNHKRQGMVLRVMQSDERSLIKPVLAVLDKAPLLRSELLSLAEYLAQKTYCTLFEAVRAMLPAGLSLQLTMSYRLQDHLSAGLLDTLSQEEQEAVRLIRNCRGPVRRSRLVELLGISEDSDLLQGLVDKGVLLCSDDAVRRVGDAAIRMVRAAAPQEELEELLTRKLTPKQTGVMDLLYQSGGASVKEVCYFAACTPAVVDALVRKGLAEYYEEEAYRSPVHRDIVPNRAEIVLTDEQSAAFDGLREQYCAGGGTALLYGVTGSGKTQVFLKLVDEVVRDGRSVIVMVPEISLTPQTLELFYARYGDRVAVMHSGLSLGERLDEWKRVRQGKASIIVGTRSAVFAPCERLGLIVMDEEQEHTYKSESSPRFHARDAARFRCAQSGALLLLASATPSVESFYAAKRGKYRLYELRKRYGEARLPRVTTIDMRLETGGSAVLSAPLKEALCENLAAGKQSVLLLNRRGYSTFVSCRSCGHVVTCPNCSISLTYHSANGQLMCHYCGHTQQMVSTCPECGAQQVRYSGCGTQRMETEIAAELPGARILRLDTDTTMARFSHERKLGAFANGEYDILLGTQMVAKGLNFPNVTLVGVVSADQSLFGDDYRSFESTFALLTQVVGRSGRGEDAGEAMIQTFAPEHPVIELAARQDYGAFFETEIASRKAMLYPPFCDICLIGFVGVEKEQVAAAAQAFLRMLTQTAKERYPDLPLRVLCPVAAAVPKAGGKYRWRLIIKCRDTRRFRQMAGELLKTFAKCPEYKRVTAYADMNPDKIL